MQISYQVFYALLRQNFYLFLRKVFDTLHAGDQQHFQPGWHVEAMCYRMQRAVEGETNRLLISVPPRHLKSIAAAVALAAWILGHRPEAEVMVATYGADLASQHSRDFRRIVESGWYQRLFPRMRLNPRLNREGGIGTTMGGSRKTVTPLGPLTGFGADCIIVDDMLKASEAQSEAARQLAHDTIQSLLTRFNDQRTGVLISIQQRLHEDDVPGRLIEAGGYDHLKLKAIAEQDECHPLYFGRVARRKAGEVLFPAGQSRRELSRLKRELGSYKFSAEYQQDPVAPGGNIVRLEWFQTHDVDLAPDRFIWVIQSWDLAYTEDPRNDFSACTTWGHHQDGYWCLIDVWRGRLQGLDLLTMIETHAERWTADRIVIERENASRHIINELDGKFNYGKPKFRPNVFAMDPRGSKKERMIGQVAKIESGRIRIPRSADWLGDFLNEVRAFPTGRHDDQVDSLSQFLEWMDSRAGMMLLTTNPESGRQRGRGYNRRLRRSQRSSSRRLLNPMEDLMRQWSD